MFEMLSGWLKNISYIGLLLYIGLVIGWIPAVSLADARSIISGWLPYTPHAMIVDDLLYRDILPWSRMGIISID